MATEGVWHVHNRRNKPQYSAGWTLRLAQVARVVKLLCDGDTAKLRSLRDVLRLQANQPRG